jgi:hypothetical protein
MSLPCADIRGTIPRQAALFVSAKSAVTVTLSLNNTPCRYDMDTLRQTDWEALDDRIEEYIFAKQQEKERASGKGK